jgi:hypothetical protein
MTYPGLVLHVILNYFSGLCNCATYPKIPLVIPRTWICCRVQSLTTDIQVRWTALVQRHHYPTLQDKFHEYLWGEEGQNDDPGDSRKVCFLSPQLSDFTHFQHSLTGIGEVVSFYLCGIIYPHPEKITGSSPARCS